MKCPKCNEDDCLEETTFDDELECLKCGYSFLISIER